MDNYFFSYLPCIIKINGTYKGTICEEVVKFNCLNGDLIEFLSPQNKFLQLNLILGEKSNCVKVFSSPYGNYVLPEYFTFTPYPYEKVFCQNFFSNTVNLSIIADGNCKLIMQNSKSLNLFNLPFKPNFVNTVFAENGYIGLLLQGEKSLFVLYDAKSNDVCNNEYGFAEYKSFLTITKSINSILQHKIIKTYSKDFETQEIAITRNNAFNFANVVLKKYAFLECIHIGDNIDDFMQNKENSNKIKGFIGSFNSIVLAPCEKYDFALIYDDTVKFIKIEIDNGLVTDIILD